MIWERSPAPPSADGNNGDEVILNGEDLGLLLEDIGRNRFSRHSYAGMRGGWSYYIILYSDDECLTDFLVTGEDKIQYGDFYYTASPASTTLFWTACLPETRRMHLDKTAGSHLIRGSRLLFSL